MYNIPLLENDEPLENDKRMAIQAYRQIETLIKRIKNSFYFKTKHQLATELYFNCTSFITYVESKEGPWRTLLKDNAQRWIQELNSIISPKKDILSIGLQLVIDQLSACLASASQADEMIRQINNLIGKNKYQIPPDNLLDMIDLLSTSCNLFITHAQNLGGSWFTKLNSYAANWAHELSGLILRYEFSNHVSIHSFTNLKKAAEPCIFMRQYQNPGGLDNKTFNLILS